MVEPTLRLSVDVTAVPARPVGAGQYTVELTGALADRGEVDLVLLCRRGDRPRWEALSDRGGAVGAQVVAGAPDSRPLRLAWEQVRMPGLLSRLGATVHHGPHYTMPERSPVPAVVTIHDLSFFEAPRWHQRSKVLLFRRAIATAARRATAVVCPSQVTADELARWCRVDAEVFVAHHGVDPRRFRREEPFEGADHAVLDRIDPRLTGGRPLVVFVGTLEPRKDVPSLVHAFARISGRHPDALVVLAGGAGWGADEVDRAIGTTGLADRVLRTGYVPDESVPALLRSAAAVVYPALYEGFGLPALEALACGAPLVTTAGTAMEEVAGDAAVLVTPGDVSGLAEAIDSQLGSADGHPPEEVRRRGFAIAAAHTWERSADRHLEAYRYAAGHGRASHAGNAT